MKRYVPLFEEFEAAQNMQNGQPQGQKEEEIKAVPENVELMKSKMREVLDDLLKAEYDKEIDYIADAMDTDEYGDYETIGYELSFEDTSEEDVPFGYICTCKVDVYWKHNYEPMTWEYPGDDSYEEKSIVFRNIGVTASDSDGNEVEFEFDEEIEM
jgi:hypothetical protein